MKNRTYKVGKMPQPPAGKKIKQLVFTIKIFCSENPRRVDAQCVDIEWVWGKKKV
jgi:hypothetical protein